VLSIFRWHVEYWKREDKLCELCKYKIVIILLPQNTNRKIYYNFTQYKIIEFNQLTTVQNKLMGVGPKNKKNNQTQISILLLLIYL